jgi:hypothetical protein
LSSASHGAHDSKTWGFTPFELKTRRRHVEVLLHTTPVFAAIGYSIVYMLAGGGVFGAFVIFVVAKMLGR